jgi:hypothetical protein
MVISNKILNKQFLFTLMISEFIIIIDYTFFYLYNQSAVSSFNAFILELLTLFFSIIFLLSFAKLATNKIFLFIPIGFFLMTLYIPLTEFFDAIDIYSSFNKLSKLLTIGLIFITWILLYYAFRYEDSQKIIKNSFFVSIIFFSVSLLEFNVLKLAQINPNYERGFELLKRNESSVKIKFNTERELPNIIYIVPDRYAGVDQLKKYFNYDNSNFLNALEDRGFVIGKHSRSNYPRSYASILSTLNSSYIIESSDKKKKRDLAIPATTNSYAYRNLYELGYKLYNLNNWWEGTRYITNEEYNFFSEYIELTQSPLRDYINLRTPYGSIVRELSEVLLQKPSNFLVHRSLECDILINQFKKLSDFTQDKDSGLFVYAHILVPHPPYLLNANGDCNPLPMRNTGPDLESNKDRYIEYLKFFNDQILSIFDVMLKTNKNFIFVIQSDEGPYPCSYMNPCNDNWDLKTANINAFYSSNKLGINENDLKTPINNFNYIYKYLLDSDVQTLEHVVYKYKTTEEDGAFNFEEINNFEIVN